MDIDTLISQLNIMRNNYGNIEVYTKEYKEDVTPTKYHRYRILNEAKVSLEQDTNGEFNITL